MSGVKVPPDATKAMVVVKFVNVNVNETHCQIARILLYVILNCNYESKRKIKINQFIFTLNIYL